MGATLDLLIILIPFLLFIGYTTGYVKININEGGFMENVEQDLEKFRKKNRRGIWPSPQHSKLYLAEKISTQKPPSRIYIQLTQTSSHSLNGSLGILCTQRAQQSLDLKTQGSWRRNQSPVEKISQSTSP